MFRIWKIYPKIGKTKEKKENSHYLPLGTSPNFGHKVSKKKLRGDTAYVPSQFRQNLFSGFKEEEETENVTGYNGIG